MPKGTMAIEMYGRMNDALAKMPSTLNSEIKNCAN